jgi:hypothetical protein
LKRRAEEESSRPRPRPPPPPTVESGADVAAQRSGARERIRPLGGGSDGQCLVGASGRRGKEVAVARLVGGGPVLDGRGRRGDKGLRVCGAHAWGRGG